MSWGSKYKEQAQVWNGLADMYDEQGKAKAADDARAAASVYQRLYEEYTLFEKGQEKDHGTAKAALNKRS